MKTQISRDSFQPDKRYSGVHQQQGRMLTDADWNELVAILKDQLARSLVDVVGNGSPKNVAVTITPELLIRPGDLYVDGLRASVPGTDAFPASKQDDLPLYKDVPSSGSHVVYADVWERSVTCLEDDNLRDKGLHGADTCTRTQTMLQVKMCPDIKGAEKDIPKIGTATWSLSLHENLEAGDPCDPCAGLISAGKGRVGNYLFRLEVHDVVEDAGKPTSLTLKWSSENGAEQYKVADEMPPGFAAADYVYEFYESNAEKHLGVCLDSRFSPVRGQLQRSYEVPSSKPSFVRRWDGYCKLKQSGGAWSLDGEGWDRGEKLSDKSSEKAPGHVTFVGGLQINLKALQLTLDLTGKTFVAGDFWLAEVREAGQAAGSSVATHPLPAGITHHYLRLARVKDGKLSTFDDDADKRRHNFPPLTDLRAGDVGYQRDQTICTRGLFDGTQDNVEKALNRLCQLDAEHVHYKADCTTGILSGVDGTVKQALNKLCEITAGDVPFSTKCNTGIYRDLEKPVTTVADALGLLCGIQAVQVSYGPDKGCNFLSQKQADTVQAALDALCARPGGCRITVGKDGVFETLGAALHALMPRTAEDPREICLCLLPGDHSFQGADVPAKLDGMHLCLSGCGHATRLHISESPAVFSNFASVGMADMEVIASRSYAGALDFERCRSVCLRGVSISGFVKTVPGLVKVAGAGSVELHSVLLEAPTTESFRNALTIFDLFERLSGLFRLEDRDVFDEAAAKLAHEFAGTSVQHRTELADGIEKQLNRLKATLLRREQQSYAALLVALRDSTPVTADFIDALGTIRGEAIRTRPGVALVVNDANCEWRLGDCEILGIVSLYGPQPAGPFPALASKLGGLVKDNVITLTGTSSTLRMSGCRLTRIDVSGRIAGRLNELCDQHKGTLDGLFDSGLLTDCTFVAGDNQLVLVNTNLSSNIFEAEDGPEARTTVVARVIGRSSVDVGNRGSGKSAVVTLVPQKNYKEVANLGLAILEAEP